MNVVTSGRYEANPPWVGALVDQGIEAILAFDADLRLVFANDATCELLGYRREDILGVEVYSMVHADDLARAAANVVGIGKGAQPDPGLLRIRRGDGDWTYYELRPRAISLPGPPDGPGDITAVSIRDNTMEDAHWLFLAQVASGAELDRCIGTFTEGLTSLVDGPMSVTYETGGKRRFSGALPPELTWPDPAPRGSPWERAILTGEPVSCPAGDLPAALSATVAALGIESLVVVPVLDPAHGAPALIVQGPYDAAMAEIVMIALSRRPKDALTIALERRDAMERLHHMAMSDPLTGLANRTSFFETLEGLAASGTTYAISSVDIDRFKDVNDSYGHQVGDEILMVCARRLAQVARTGDVVGRLGGDEFAVIHVGVGPDQAPVLAARLVEALNQPVDIGGFVFDLGASVGVASTGSHDDLLPDDIMAASDAALYRAKRAGRGTWRYAEPDPVQVRPGASSDV